MTSSLHVSPPSPAASPGGRILAIDYGRKRFGLALSDELGLTAQPLATWLRTNRRNDVRRLRELARQHAVGRILVGLPVHLDGRPSEMAAEAERFAARIGKELGLPVELVDERLSTWEAEQTLESAAPAGELGCSRSSAARKRRGEMDQIAAAIILRDYLARERGRASDKG